MYLKSLNLDPETERLVREGGWEGSLAPFMIIYEDGMVESFKDETGLCDSIKTNLNEGFGEEMYYIFCDGIQADYEYIDDGVAVIEVILSPSDLNDDIARNQQHDVSQSDLDIEMDREMQMAMDMDCTVGRGYANC